MRVVGMILAPLVSAALVAGCLDDAFLDGKQCDPQGGCLAGYVCDPGTGRCVVPPLPDGGEPGEAGDGDGDVNGDVNGDGDGGVQAPPIVLFTFESIPNPPLVPDESGEEPQVKLSPDDRNPVGVDLVAGTAVFSGGRLDANPGASKNLGDAIVSAGSFTVEIWASTDTVEQTGPARLVTLSSGSTTRAFTLGHEGTDLVARLRTSITDENGHDLEQFVLAFTGTNPRHFVLSFEGATGAASVYVDGQLRDVVVHLTEAEQPAVLEWDTGRERFGLGDEFDADRRWYGTLHRVAIWNMALDADMIRTRFLAGPAD